jgi:hypothetical protein
MFSDQPTTISTTLLPSSSGVDLLTPRYPVRPLPFTQPQYTQPWPNLARSVEPMAVSTTKLLSQQQLCALRDDRFRRTGPLGAMYMVNVIINQYSDRRMYLIKHNS